MSEHRSSFASVISFSAGTGSSALCWMVLRGIIPRPKRLLVQYADPGMENSGSYVYRDMLFDELKKADIPCAIVPGPSLYRDIITLRERSATRIDSPPYFVAKANGKRGQLMQKCTQYYKIAPMNKHLRQWIRHKYWCRSVRPGMIERWIGFTADEQMRIKPSRTQYVTFRYPLIELGLSKCDLASWYKSENIPIPPRSVCNACFANSVEFYRKMSAERPADFQQACAVDETVRDWSQVGVVYPVFVSDTLKPIREITSDNTDNIKDYHYDLESQACTSGFCFV